MSDTIDVVALARELGPDRCAALAWAIVNSMSVKDAAPLEAAARRLAAPLPVAPGVRRCWWVQRDDEGWTETDPSEVEACRKFGLTVTEGLYVPADAVVLSRGDALAALRWLRELQRRGFTYASGGSDHIETTAAALRAALAASAPTEER